MDPNRGFSTPTLFGRCLQNAVPVHPTPPSQDVVGRVRRWRLQASRGPAVVPGVQLAPATAPRPIDFDWPIPAPASPSRECSLRLLGESCDLRPAGEPG